MSTPEPQVYTMGKSGSRGSAVPAPAPRRRRLRAFRPGFPILASTSGLYRDVVGDTRLDGYGLGLPGSEG